MKPCFDPDVIADAVQRVINEGTDEYGGRNCFAVFTENFTAFTL